MANEHLHMFGFVELPMISQPSVAGANVDEQVIVLANRFQSASKIVLLFITYNVSYNIR